MTKLYANGCSFTYGTGLTNKDTAWPYVLADKLEIDDVINEAQRGVSNPYIMRSTITTISEMIDNGEKPDFVTIGMTAPSRREHFIEDKNILIHNVPSVEYHGNIMLSEEENSNVDIYNRIYTALFTSQIYDFHLYLMQVLSLQNFFRENDIDYIIFNSLNLTQNLLEPTSFSKLCEQSDMMAVYNQLDTRKIFDQETFFTHMYDMEDGYFTEEDQEKYLHPTEKAHESWANYLYRYIDF
jgi:hypothetical protein